MNWKRALEEYRNYLVLEKAHANNTIEAYLHDLTKLADFSLLNLEIKDCTKLNTEAIRLFIINLHEQGASSKSQARILSSLKSFYNYLELEECIKVNPLTKIDNPSIERKTTRNT